MDWKLYGLMMLISQLSFTGGAAMARKQVWLWVPCGLITGAIATWMAMY